MLVCALTPLLGAVDTAFSSLLRTQHAASRHDGLVEAVIYCVRSGQAAMQGHEGMVLAHMTATKLAATSCFAAPGGEGLISAAWNRALRGATNTCVNTSFSMSTPAVLTPVLVCQHLLLKARSCVNVNK